MIERPSRRRVVATLLLVVGIAWVLVRSGSGALDVPVSSTSELRRWFDDSEPAVLAAAVLRLSGLAACAYMGAVLTFVLAADLVRSRCLMSVPARLAPELLRRWLIGSTSLGLAAGAMFPPPPADASTMPRPVPRGEVPADTPTVTAVMVRLDEDAPAVDSESATMTKLAPVPSATSTTTPPTTASSAAPSTTTPTASPPASATAPPRPGNSTSGSEPGGERWVVMPGESFWSIAEQVLAEAGDEPSEREMAAYWQRLIAANRDRLADPDNPDLLYPGQELILPD